MIKCRCLATTHEIVSSIQELSLRKVRRIIDATPVDRGPATCRPSVPRSRSDPLRFYAFFIYIFFNLFAVIDTATNSAVDSPNSHIALKNREQRQRTAFSSEGSYFTHNLPQQRSTFLPSHYDEQQVPSHQTLFAGPPLASLRSIGIGVTGPPFWHRSTASHSSTDLPSHRDEQQGTSHQTFVC